MLVPQDEWWTAAWNVTGGIELYVDVTTPPQWPSDGHVTMVDLDLDVFRRRDGTVVVDDEDEFLEHQIAFGYPQDVVATAQATTEYLLEAVTSRREPFGSAGEAWMERLLSR